jgi:hypothetical protein
MAGSRGIMFIRHPARSICEVQAVPAQRVTLVVGDPRISRFAFAVKNTP